MWPHFSWEQAEWDMSRSHSTQEKETLSIYVKANVLCICVPEKSALVFVVKFYNMRNFVQRKHTHSHINFTTYKLMEM